MCALAFKQGRNQRNMGFDIKKESSFGSINQASGRKFEDRSCPMIHQARSSTLQTTFAKPFKFKTQERCELRAANADKRSKLVEERVKSQVIKTRTRSRKMINQASGGKFEDRPCPMIHQARSSTLHTTVAKPFSFRTQERCELRASNADKRSKLVEGRVESQVNEKLPSSCKIETTLHDALCERIQQLELVSGQEMPNYGSPCAEINQKCTQLSLDVSSYSERQQVAKDANTLSSATLVRSDSQLRSSIDPLNFISLESCGGIILTHEDPADFEFIMDPAINCSFDGSHVEKEISASVSMDAFPSRIWDNPLFSSKPKKSDTTELETKIQTLEAELTTLSAQLLLFQRDRTCMIAEIKDLRLRLQNMEQEVLLQHTLHYALCERIQQLELVASQAMPNYGSPYAEVNQKCTQLCLDVSSYIEGQQVATDANPLSSATLVRSDSEMRASIDPLNLISLESYGGILLTEEDPAINCSFDGSYFPGNCITYNGIGRDPTSRNECDKRTSLSCETLDSHGKRRRNLCPESWNLITNSATTRKDDFVLNDADGDGLPSPLSSVERSKEGMELDEGNESRQLEDLGYWEKCCMIDRMDQCFITNGRFDPFDEFKESGVQEDTVYWLPVDGMVVISYPQDETNESTEEHGECCEKPSIYQPLDKVNEPDQEKEDKGYYLENPDTMDPSLEFLLKNGGDWDQMTIEGYLSLPGVFRSCLREHHCNLPFSATGIVQ